MTRDIESYFESYVSDYGFEQVMVRYRASLVLRRVSEHKPSSVLEIGCGSELLYARYLETSPAVASWVIVEPAHEFAHQARMAKLPNCTVIEAPFEDATGETAREFLDAPDMIICSGLLHEVSDADRLLRAIVQRMGPHTVLHVNVPNAQSMHRQLAQAMGLVDSLTELSERNVTLLQHRVYDSDILRADLENVGLAVAETGALLIKPFTHKQMEAIAPVLTNEVLDGLDRLAQAHPEWGSEIFAEARRVRSG